MNADREARLWNASFAALAAVIAVATFSLAQRTVPVAAPTPVPTFGLVAIDYGADGHVDEEVMIRVEGARSSPGSAPLAVR